jgi:hypothetical protein
MSRFKIYRVDHFDPERVGGNKRRLFALYSILSPLTIAALSTFMQTKTNPFIVAAIVLPVTTVVYLYLYRKLKNEPRKFKTIGDIEFTRTLIKKRIGDSITEYNFESIKEIELEKHIPSVSPKDSKSGYFTYILRIIFYDATTESLVVSDNPIESQQNLSIVDTMKTLKKIIQPAVRIII